MIKLDKSNHLLMSLKPLFKVMSQQSLQGAKRPSRATVEQRERNIVQEMKVLQENGYQLKALKNIKQKHLDCLFKNWYQRDYTLSTLNKRISLFSLVLKAIGKAGMQVTTLNEHPIPKSFYTQKTELKKDENNLNKDDYRQKIERMSHESKEFAIHAKLMMYFGLSKKESLNINPVLSHCNSHLIISNAVTRGKERSVSITNDYQRQTIDDAKALVGGKSITIMPKKTKEQQWINRFDYLCKKYEIKPSNLTKIYSQESSNAIEI